MFAGNTATIKSTIKDGNSISLNLIEFTINGKKVKVNADLYPTLLQAIREELKLTGTKYGCGEGVCGACTVLLNGKPARSCITPVTSIANKEVITIEGEEGLSEAELEERRERFIEGIDFFETE